MTQFVGARRSPRSWLVTGAGGFLGSYAVEFLLSLDQTVIGFDNFTDGSRHNLAIALSRVGADRARRFRLVQGDVMDLEDVRAVCAHADCVVHLAGVPGVRATAEAPLYAHKVNVLGTLTVLQAAKDMQVRRVVLTSSAVVYPDLMDRHPESDPTSAGSMYAVQCLTVEDYARQYHMGGLETVCMRLFNVYGPRQQIHGAYCAVIPSWLMAMHEGVPPEVSGDGWQTRDFVYVADAVQALVKAGLIPGVSGCTFNVGSGVGMHINDVYYRVLEAYGYQKGAMLPVHGELLSDEHYTLVADPDLTASVLDWRATTDLTTGIQRTVDFYRNLLI